jgi:uracil-DNA glycosylase family 4
LSFAELACEGYGEKPAEFMFVGISAGKLGALRTRVPFTRDASGRLFQRTLYRLGLSETSDEKCESPKLVRCWVTNLVKSRVLDTRGNNRLPTEEEAEHWWPYMEKEMKDVNPWVVVTLSEFVHKCFARHNVWHFGLKHPRWYQSQGALGNKRAFSKMVRDYGKALDYYVENVAETHWCQNLNTLEVRNMDSGELIWPK